MLTFLPNFVYFRSYLQNKDYYMNKRLCNIFKTVNAMVFTKTILESPYKVMKRP